MAKSSEHHPVLLSTFTLVFMHQQVWDQPSWNNWERTTLWPTYCQWQWPHSASERPHFNTTIRCSVFPGSRHTVMQFCCFKMTMSLSKPRSPLGLRGELVGLGTRVCQLRKWTGVLVRPYATHFFLYGVPNKGERALVKQLLWYWFVRCLIQVSTLHTYLHYRLLNHLMS